MKIRVRSQKKKKKKRAKEEESSRNKTRNCIIYNNKCIITGDNVRDINQ